MRRSPIHTLYGCHDRLLEHKEALFDHLVDRWRDLFNASLRCAAVRPHEHLLRVRSAARRGGQAPPRLLARSSPRLRAGGDRVGGDARRAFRSPTRCWRATRATAARCTDFSARIERQYGKAERVWCMDRGIPTEEVLEQMRAADPPVHYLVGTPKGRLTRLEQALLGKPWHAGAARGAGEAAARRTRSSTCSPRAAIASPRSARCAGGN